MLKNYLKLSLKILGRRKFFTFVSLFGIIFLIYELLLFYYVLRHRERVGKEITRWFSS